MKLFPMLLLIAHCTNEPILYERNPDGPYPKSAAMLNGEPVWFIGIKHHFERAK